LGKFPRYNIADKVLYLIPILIEVMMGVSGEQIKNYGGITLLSNCFSMSMVFYAVARAGGITTRVNKISTFLIQFSCCLT
jgi:hypothetical protein